jgi:uncharacterized membrane protein YdjX (TVP38/TMEM64 family)
MVAIGEPKTAAVARRHLHRLAPVLIAAAALLMVYATGWQRDLSLETLLRHHADIDDFVATHRAVAVLAFVALYTGAAALAIPAGLLLALLGGFLFGALLGGFASMIGSTTGATVMFLVARSAFGGHLLRRAGPAIGRFAAGFRADAFNYLVFLRLIPVPSWVTNVTAAALQVSGRTFVAATVAGRSPGSFVFAFLGAGLGSVIDVQETQYRECLAAGSADCRIDFDPHSILTPTLVAGLLALGLLALVPVVARRLRCRRAYARNPDLA